MVVAVYADAGAGLAFLLLLILALAGLGAVVACAVERPAARRSPLLFVAAVGVLQAWPVYFWARSALAHSRRTVEWVWLGSLCVVLAAVVCAALAGWRGRQTEPGGAPGPPA